MMRHALASAFAVAFLCVAGAAQAQESHSATITIRNHRFEPAELKVPANKRFTLWAVSPDGKYTKLGQIVNAPGREEAEIVSETSLTDFGLFITAEDADVTVPTSRTYTVFTVS